MFRILAMMVAAPKAKESPHLKAYRHFDEVLEQIRQQLDELKQQKAGGKR